MAIHAFVDESIRRDRYILCAVLIPGEQLHRARALVRSFCLPGQRRWHFNDESEQRQRHIIAAMAQCVGVGVAIYEGRGREVSVRHSCMTELVTDLVEIKAARLVIESRENQDQRDRQSIATVLRKASAELQYAHMPPHTEPCLWWADAAAWAFGAGGRWRLTIMPLVRLVFDVNKPPLQRETRMLVVRPGPGSTSSG
ncbi:hypothetical protein [Nocardia brasiliensis]|uniref:hypothetical protein n=1 Tax=Nocardia brasiliensis TaxID=37326 RepID=UPI001894507E|nr:hypothetical protein [Nocardia brasiliensis]MBF6124869.1 hypothetical protein [Nocardia brasiliensis]